MDSVKISDWDSRITYIPSPSESADCSSPSKAEDPICGCRWRSIYDAAANISLHTTCGPDTALELSFVGSELQLWGSTSSEGALAYVTIDNDTSTAATVNFTSTDGQTHNNVLLLDIAGLDLDRDPSRDHLLRLQYDNASYAKQTKKRRYMFVDWFVVTQMTGDNGSSKGSPDSTGGSTIQPPAPPLPPHTTSDIDSSSTSSMSGVLFSRTQDSHTDVEVSSVLVVSGTTLTVTATVDVTNGIAISSASASHSSDGRASRSFSLTRHDISSSSSATEGDSDSASSNSDSNFPYRKTMATAISLSVVAFAVISLLLVLFLRRRGRHPHRLRAKSPDSSMHARPTTFDTSIRPFTLALSPCSPPQRSKTSTRDTLQVPGQDAAGQDEPGPPRPSMDSARTRVAV